MWQDRVRALCLGWTRVSVDDVLAHVSAAPSQAHAEDLALAFGVARGEPAALAQFEATIAPEIAAVVRTIDGAPSFVDELTQQARIKLLIGDPPRIASYLGTGPLRAWVAIAARRLAINAKRDARAGAAARGTRGTAGTTGAAGATGAAGTAGDRRHDPLEDVLDREPDPELRHLKQLYRGELREALANALTGLPDRSRAILRLRFVEGLELAQLGALYRVHESTASRWVAAALDDVASATHKHLMARLAVTAHTAASVARMVHSNLDLSIARLLG